MAGLNDYVVDVIVQAKAEGMRAFGEVATAMAAMTAAAEASNEVLKHLSETQDRHNEILNRHSGYLRDTTASVRGMEDAIRNLDTAAGRASGGGGGGGGGGLWSFFNMILPGGTTAASLTVAIAGLAAAFLPFTLYVAGAVAVLGAFVVGMTATLGVITIGIGGFLGLAAAIAALGIAALGGMDPVGNLEKAQTKLQTASEANEAAQQNLAKAQLAVHESAKPTAAQMLNLQIAQEKAADAAQKLAQAQQAVDDAAVQAQSPFAQLHEQVVQIGQAFGQQAAPMVNMVAAALITVLPTVQTIGQQILNWFGARLPEAIRLGGDLLQMFLGAGTRLAAGWTKIVDDIFAHPVDYQRVLGYFIDLSVRAILGLMENLLRLSDWFMARLPAIQPIVEKVFGQMGDVLQGLFGLLGGLVDWFLANWPTITRVAESLWHAIGDGIARVMPVLAGFVGFMAGAMAPVLEAIREHASSLLPVIAILAAVIVGVLVVAFFVVAAVIVTVVAVIVGLVSALKFLYDNSGNVTKAVGDAFSVMGKTIHDSLDQDARAVGTAFDWIGTKINQSLTQDQAVIVSIWNAIAAFFAAVWAVIVNTVQASVTQDYNAIVAAWTAIQSFLGVILSAILGAVGSAWNAITSTIGAWLNTQWTQITDMWSRIHGWLAGAWSTITTDAQNTVNGIGNAFSGVGRFVHEGLQGAANVINGFADAINRALGVFNVHVNGIPAFAQGGVVPGYAPGQDSVLARLSPGEGVLTPQAVRGLGGAAAIDTLNSLAASGLIAAYPKEQMGANMTPGTWGGQCVVFVEAVTGHYFPVAYASQMTAWVNSQTAKPGEIAVFTGAPFGHVAIVAGPGDYSFPVIDSNWVGPEIIGVHQMNKGMYGFSGFIDVGLPMGTLAGVPGFTLPSTILNGLVGPIEASARAVGGFGGNIALGLVHMLRDGILKKFDSGGYLMPGMGAYNASGAAERVLSPSETRAYERGGRGFYNITFNIQGGNPEQIAAAIDRRLGELLNAT